MERIYRWIAAVHMIGDRPIVGFGSNGFVENYKNYKVIISTWIDSNIDFRNIPNNFSLIQHKLPDVKGPQNTNLQLLSTLNGLKYVDTKYVIKIRGDEYYSNFESVAHFIKKNA